MHVAVASDLPPLSAEGESALYRTMQEALSNAVRHAGAHEVWVELRADAAGASLTVADDGPGFPDDAATRLRSRGGLAGIRERVGALGGHFDIGTDEQGGARVYVTVPGAGTTREAGVT